MERPNSDQILNAILSAGANERLGRVKMFKPEQAKKIETKLLTMYQTGQVKQQIDEDAFIKIADSFQEQKKDFKVIRRKNFSDLDDF